MLIHHHLDKISTTLFFLNWALLAATAEPPPLRPQAEIEEKVYSFEPADNGAGPMWCGGSTCLVRIGDRVFASGIETLKDAKPLNNCRWLLFERGTSGWVLQQADRLDRTREPSPLVGFPDGRLWLSVNPTLVTDRQAYNGPARPEILEFAATNAAAPFQRWRPQWSGSPRFTEHSYRSFAADGPNHELILFQNIDYTHAEWVFRDREGRWAAQGQLSWPWGAEYAKPQPIRVCYPNVALHHRAVHFCGVSDIVEPNPEWRAYKKQITGREWDYDFRRLFYTWTPDISTGKFNSWIELASREQTCGWVSPGDLWIDPDGTVHVVWTERAVDERLRAKFFPQARQSHELNYAILREGQVISRRTLLKAEEGGRQEIPSSARFHLTPDHRLWVVFYVSGSNTNGRSVSENRLMELRQDGKEAAVVVLPLQKPFTTFFTATPRGGSPPSIQLELLGHQTGMSQTISYARIQLYPPDRQP